MAILSSRYGMDSETNVFTRFYRSIFGSNTGKFRQTRNWNPVNAKTVLIDTSYNELINVAQYVPHLNTVISRGAEIFSSMKIKHLDANKKDIKNSDILKLINKPNPIQGRSDFLYDYYVNKGVHGSAFGYKNKGPLGKLPQCLWWLPSGLMRIETTGKLYQQTDISGIIEKYVLQVEDQDQYEQYFKPNDIIHITDGICQNKLAGSSKIESLQIPLSNIVASLKSLNIIITERGMIGFIGGDAKDSTGMGIQMTEKERTQFENAYQNRYGLDSTNGHVMITQAPLKWVPMTFDVKQLMLLEGLEDSFAQICAAYGLDRDIFPSIKGATFENKKQGLITTIQNTMMPQGEVLCEILADQFGLTDKGETLAPSWDHLPVMQDDKVEKETAKKLRAETSTIHLNNGAIDIDTYAEENEIKRTGDGVSVTEKLQKQANEANANQQNKDGKTKGA